jgi:hypothetical protein
MEMEKSTWRKGVILSILVLLLITSPLMAEENPYDKAVHAYMKKDFRTAVKYLKEYVAQKPDPGLLTARLCIIQAKKTF